MEETLYVKNPSYEEFFTLYGKDYKIQIPPYQRSYVWDNKKVEQLLIDWKEFLESESSNNNPWYYMGSLIIHIDRKRRILNIVDGQQRLTTLLMIDFELNKDNSALKKYSNLLDFKFSSHISRGNIMNNIKLLRNLLSVGDKYVVIKESNIFPNLRFSVIMTDNEDDAFTFFDSQNNRGVQPAAVDVMKAVHLRAIQNDDELRKHCAIKWQEIQVTGNNIFRNSPENYLDNLVDMALWRIRRWKGNHFENNSDYNTAMDEFANNPQKGYGDMIRYYSTASESMIKYYQDMKVQENILDKDINIEKKHPFNVRQPLLKGVSVFSYLETYHMITKKLFIDKNTDKDISLMKELYYNLYIKTRCSKYMTDFFIIMMIAYYDKFGTRKLYKFAMLIDFIIGMIRLNTYYFKKVTMRNFMQEHNILDVLQICFEPEEVFAYISSLDIKDENRNPKNEPIRSYVDACTNYFGQTFDGDLRDVKLKWTEKSYE